jgi:hypothetical protein
LYNRIAILRKPALLRQVSNQSEVKVAIGNGRIGSPRDHNQPVGLSCNGIGAVSTGVVDIGGVFNVGEHSIIGAELCNRDPVDVVSYEGEVGVADAKRGIRNACRDDAAVGLDGDRIGLVVAAFDGAIA